MDRALFIPILCAICFSAPYAAEIDVCQFDEYVLGMMNEITVSNQSTRHLELLDFVAEYGSKTTSDICKDNTRKEKLTRIAYTLYTESEGNEEFHKVYTRYAFFQGNEERGRIATGEDNAMYNMLLDYMIAKYDSRFAFEKKEMLRDGDKTPYALLEAIAKKYFTPSQLASIAKSIGKAVPELGADLLSSWAGLWLDNESPVGRDERFDLDYAWILRVRDNFLQKYPESRYREAINAIMDDDVAAKLKESDKNDGIAAFGIVLSAGKTFKSSSLENVEETFTLDFPQGRIQIYHIVFQFQLDALFKNIKKFENSSVGFNGLLGYTFEFGDYGIDVLGGLGYMPIYTENDSTDNLAFLGSIQLIKRLPIGDILNLSPKFQWVIKGSHFDDPIAERKRWGIMNQLLFGITFEARQPISRLSTKDYGKKHQAIRRTGIGP